MTKNTDNGARGARTAVILQSNYIPWKGYFDLIGLADEFVLFDDVQYTRRDWRNRNLIKTPAGLAWLTIPVDVKGKYFQRIEEVTVNDPKWGKRHWATLTANYGKATYFRHVKELIEPLYLGGSEVYLSRINHAFISAICSFLGIDTRISYSSAYPVVEGRNERLITICQSTGCSRYLSGPSAKSYIDEGAFAAAGVSVAWMDYSGYPPYRQLHGAFEHGVTILDLLFNEGPSARQYMKFPE